MQPGLAVVLQGVLGGLRVLGNSVPLAVVHGCFAQAFFVLSIALVAVTSRQWGEDAWAAREPKGPIPSAADNTALVWACVGGVLVIYMQLILGAIVRHLTWTWIPHMAWAVMVGLALMTMARYVFQHAYARERLGSPTIAMLVLYFMQLAIGLTTLLVVYPMWSEGIRSPQTFLQTWLPTIHLAVGATILGIAGYVAVRATAIGKWSPAGVNAEVQGVPA